MLDTVYQLPFGMFRMLTIVQFWVLCVPHGDFRVKHSLKIPITSAYQFSFWVDGSKIYQSEVEHYFGFPGSRPGGVWGRDSQSMLEYFARAHIHLIAERQTSP